MDQDIKDINGALETLRGEELDAEEERRLLFTRAFAAEKTIYYELFTGGRLSERAYRDLCYGVGLEAEAVRHGLPMPSDPLRFRQDHSLRSVFYRVFDRTLGFTGLPERLRLYHVVREYEEAWGRYQGCTRILDELDTLVFAALTPPDIVAENTQKIRALDGLRPGPDRQYGGAVPGIRQRHAGTPGPAAPGSRRNRDHP